VIETLRIFSGDWILHLSNPEVSFKIERTRLLLETCYFTLLCIIYI